MKIPFEDGRSRHFYAVQRSFRFVPGLYIPRVSSGFVLLVEIFPSRSAREAWIAEDPAHRHSIKAAEYWTAVRHIELI